jgi:hypothetical protein
VARVLASSLCCGCVLDRSTLPLIMTKENYLKSSGGKEKKMKKKEIERTRYKSIVFAPSLTRTTLSVIYLINQNKI